jgi:hypothetical protein
MIVPGSRPWDSRGQFKWDRDRQQWYRPISLKNLEALDRWPEVEFSPEARQALGEFRKEERKRRE